MLTISYSYGQRGDLAQYCVHPVEVPDLDLILLALGYIGDDACDSVRLAGIIPNRVAAGVYPAHLAIGPDDAQIEVEICTRIRIE